MFFKTRTYIFWGTQFNRRPAGGKQWAQAGRGWKGDSRGQWQEEVEGWVGGRWERAGTDGGYSFRRLSRGPREKVSL